MDSLAARRKAQVDTADRFKVFFKFRFTDMLKESGITFFHHMVDDAGIDYKPVHYDHGTGVAVADVDGDGLYDIYFVNQVGGNELWKNLGGGKFSHITTKAGVGLPGRISVTASFADVDNDGAEDLFVTTVLGGNALFKNDGSGVFKDITKDAGLDLVSHSSGSVFLRLRQRWLARPARLQRRQVHQRRKGRPGSVRGVAGRLRGSSASPTV